VSNRVAAVCEPLPTVSLRDAMSCAPRDATQCVGLARCDAANVLLLQRPPRFDRIEVVRVWWQVDHAYAASSVGRSHTRVVMGTKVVHYDHSPRLSFGSSLVLSHLTNRSLFAVWLVLAVTRRDLLARA